MKKSRNKKRKIDKNSKKKSKNKNWKVLLLSLVIVYLVAYLGSLFTSPNTSSDWYNSIRPSITPPNRVFPVVWNVLFFLIALSLYFSWMSSNKLHKTKLFLLFGTNFLLNILWTILYFGLKNPSLAFIDILLLLASIFVLILFTYHISKKASYLLWPYLVWVAFASVLNYLSIQF